MEPNDNNRSEKTRRIRVLKNSAYVVEGGIPLVSKTQVVSELGEPLTWQTDGPIPTRDGNYLLCRCGVSGERPFCDGAHRKAGFDGTETAGSGLTIDRRFEMPGGTGITVMNDPSLCMLSGFCGFSDANLQQMVAATQDTKTRALLTAMVERCPSGSLTYRLDPQGPEIEPDLPQQIAVTTEITSGGSIAGPLWVTGNIPIECSDGQLLETRNRVTLCNCGLSANKPLCDGAHRLQAEKEMKARR